MVLTESDHAAHQAVPQNSLYETALPVKKRANLSSFFQRGSRKAPLRFKCAVTGKALERKVLKQVSPLLLKPSIPRTRIHSLPTPDNFPPLCVRRKRSEKMINTKGGLWAFPSTSYSSTEGTLSSDLSPKTLDDGMGITHDGIALIHSPILRSEEEIIAEMGDIHLPAYALDLLEDLDYIHDKIPLRPGSTALDRSLFPDAFSSALLITPSDWDYQQPSPQFASPKRTATVRIPDRRLADALLTSQGTNGTPRRRTHSHKVSLDPAFLKDDSGSDKLGDVAPLQHSAHVSVGGGRRPGVLLKKKSSGVFSLSSRSSDRREATTTSALRKSKNIASLVKKRMSAINKFR